MIQDNDGFCHMENIFTFCIAGTVHIHHNHQCILIHKFPRLMAVNEHVIVVICAVQEPFHQRPHRTVGTLQHNMCPLVQGFRRAVNTDRRAKGIRVCIFVSHNHDTFLA